VPGFAAVAWLARWLAPWLAVQAAAAEPAAPIAPPPALGGFAFPAAGWSPLVRLAGAGHWIDQAGVAWREYRLDLVEAGAQVAHVRPGAVAFATQAELRADAPRSAGPGSLYGVLGNAAVLRLVRGWAGAQVAGGAWRAGIRAGLVADPWLDAIQADNDLRPLLQPLGELTGALDLADLGAAVKLRWRDRVEVSGQVHNGEGLNQPELNRGYDSTLVARALVFADRWLGQPVGLTLAAMVRDGSRGVAYVRDHRTAWAIVARLPHMTAGAEGLRAHGLDQDPARQAAGTAIWARAGAAFDDGCLYAGIYASWNQWNRDQLLQDGGESWLRAGVHADWVGAPESNGRLRAAVGWQGRRVGAQTPAAPGQLAPSDEDDMVLQLSWQQGAGQP
jgi:hypothetical protein